MEHDEDVEAIPAKSSAKYFKAYEIFKKWLQENRYPEVNENIMECYFKEQLIDLKPSTLWTSYSMLRLMILTRRNINIGNYQRLHLYLKKKSEGYIPRKSSILTRHHITTFLKNADDDHYLLIKVQLLSNTHSINFY